MGIQNDAILCYGIEFSYHEIKILKENEHVKLLANKIGDDFMPNLWDELGFISASWFFDSEEEYRSYIIGKCFDKDVTLNEFLQEINENEMKTFLQKKCREYNLQYSEPKIFCRPNVY
jgi:hypothetical protein